MLIVGAYFKRRNNLLFIAETLKKIRGAELEYCLRESFLALEFNNVACEYLVDIGEEIALSDIMKLYDLFESVLEETKGCLKTIAVFIREEENIYQMDINICIEPEKSCTFDPFFEVEQEEANEYLLTGYFRGEAVV